MRDFIARLVDSPASWMGAGGPLHDVVHSTRIRVARNLIDYPFPARADAGTLEAVKDEGRKLLSTTVRFQGLIEVDLDQLGPLDREFLVERHLISRDFAVGHGRLLIADPEERVAVMVNEEDHFRFQSLRAGLDVFEAWQVMKLMEREADSLLSFAFRSPWGYLTSCPTNLGTGLRVSALCHLPALSALSQLTDVFGTAAQVGINVRGFYGEGSEAVGNFFQFSNRATLGQSEEEILLELEGWVKQLCEKELRARDRILKTERLNLEDRVHRALGVLSSARLLPSGELMNLLSLVRLGVHTGILSSPDHATLNLLQLAAQPAHLQKREKRNLPPVERDIARANFVRSCLGA